MKGGRNSGDRLIAKEKEKEKVNEQEEIYKKRIEKLIEEKNGKNFQPPAAVESPKGLSTYHIIQQGDNEFQKEEKNNTVVWKNNNKDNFKDEKRIDDRDYYLDIKKEKFYYGEDQNKKYVEKNLNPKGFFSKFTKTQGGKRRTKRRRQRRTNKRKKTKTRMKKRKTSKRKTNKRRRKR